MILKQIVRKKQAYLKHKKFKNYSYEKTISFREAMQSPGMSIIGEVKKASPSKDVIKEQLSIDQVTHSYNQCVQAISVITEQDFFQGSENNLIAVRQQTHLPILRKDFIIDERQIVESKKMGANAILLITSILNFYQLKKFIRLANELNLDALVEVHNKAEVKKALKAGAKIIGINNRDLKTFKIDLKTTKRLKQMIPNNTLVISESGLQQPKDLKTIGTVDGVLIGETFMRSNNIVKTAEAFKNG
jgi:indole-3-glycerol phosphate synthase